MFTLATTILFIFKSSCQSIAIFSILTQLCQSGARFDTQLLYVCVKVSFNTHVWVCAC